MQKKETSEKADLIAVLDRKEVRIRRLVDQVLNELLGMRTAYENLSKEYSAVVKKLEKGKK